MRIINPTLAAQILTRNDAVDLGRASVSLAPSRRPADWPRIDQPVNSQPSDANAIAITRKKPEERRQPGPRLMFTVFKRDNFRCVSCGKSPAIQLGVELHADHIKPWSRGGRTVIENLQTLCSACNLGKGDME